MAAHSSWLQARAEGATFLAQNPEVQEISDEDSCVGMSRDVRSMELEAVEVFLASRFYREHISVGKSEIVQDTPIVPGQDWNFQSLSAEAGKSSIEGQMPGRFSMGKGS